VLRHGDLEAVRIAALHEHPFQAPGTLHLLGVEDRVSTGEAAETARFERPELCRAQGLHADFLGAPACGGHDAERQQRQQRDHHQREQQDRPIDAQGPTPQALIAVISLS